MHNSTAPTGSFTTRYGHVLQCDCCGRIQIEFRGLSLLIDAEEFEALFGTVVQVLDEFEGRNETACSQSNRHRTLGPFLTSIQL